jgi:hypothetical protein
MSDFIFEATGDGSPTLRLEAGGEAMHSSLGAFSETNYIYGDALRLALGRAEALEPRVLSMGLGLGYVEILAAALALRAGAAERLSGESFERVPELRAWFLAWLNASPAALPAPAPDGFAKAYEEILARAAAAAGVEAGLAREALATAVASGRWRLSGALERETEFARPFACVCFDAFSSKTSPELWTEPFLDGFLARATASKCVFSTYACTGTLKRSLARAGFRLEIRPGFGKKRDCAFARR